MGKATPQASLADGLLEVGWLLAACLAPLAVNLWGSQPFELPKVAVVRTLVWIMAGCWLFDCLAARHSSWRDLRDNPLLWPTLALSGAWILSTVLAVDPGLSLWGSYERGQGLLTLLSYLLLFLLVSARLRTRLQIERLVVVIVATGVPLVCLAAAQALGWQPVPLVSDARSPVYATLGRSNFLGAYLALVLPLTLSWAWAAQRRWLRAAGAILALAELAVIGLTLARGAWLAAGAGLGALAVAGCWPRLRVRRSRWLKAALAAGVMVALAVGLAVAIALGLGGRPGGARRTIWLATAELIASGPGSAMAQMRWGSSFHRFTHRRSSLPGPRADRRPRTQPGARRLVTSRGPGGTVGLAARQASPGELYWTAGVSAQTWLPPRLATLAAQVAGNLVSFDDGHGDIGSIGDGDHCSAVTAA